MMFQHILIKKRDLPRESPTRKRAFSAHLLSESDSEDGIFHASVLPPTNKSLACDKPTKKDISTKAHATALWKQAIDIESLERLRKRPEGGWWFWRESNSQFAEFIRENEN